MARPAGDADRRMVGAALEMLPRTGLSGLSVRQVAARAGVNLGMFHYHFRSKREFSRQILQELYDSFFSRLVGAIDQAGGGPPRERLRHAILAAAQFVREHRPLLIALIKDVLSEDREVIEFARRNFPRHILVLVRLVRESQKAGAIRKMPVIQILPYLFASVVGPMIAVVFFEKVVPDGLRGLPRALLGPLLMSDRAVADRLDLVLDSLAPAGGRKK